MDLPLSDQNSSERPTMISIIEKILIGPMGGESMFLIQLNFEFLFWILYATVTYATRICAFF